MSEINLDDDDDESLQVRRPKLQVRGDTELVCPVECLFSSQLMPVPIYTAW